MTAKELRAIRDASPFKPFSLQMLDGTKVRVRHPDNFATPSVWPGMALVAFRRSGHFQAVRLRDIVGVSRK
jgi:hypothetical protein